MSKTLENAFVFVATLLVFCVFSSALPEPFASAKLIALLFIGCVSIGFVVVETHVHWQMSLVSSALLALWALCFRMEQGPDLFQYWTIGLAALAYFFFLASRSQSAKSWLQWALIAAALVQVVAIFGAPSLWPAPSAGGLTGSASSTAVLFGVLALWIFEDDENPWAFRLAALAVALVMICALRSWGTLLLVVLLPTSMRVWRSVGAFGFFVIASVLGLAIGALIQKSAGSALMGHAFLSLMGLEMVGQSPLAGGGLLYFASESFAVGQKLLSHDPRFLEIFGSQSSLPLDPRNLVLSTAVAAGILGLLVLAAIVFLIFGRLGTARDQGLKAAIIFWLLNSLYAPALTDPVTLYLGAALLGVLQKEDDDLMPHATGDRLPRLARLAFAPFLFVIILGCAAFVRDEFLQGSLKRSLASQDWSRALEVSNQLVAHRAREPWAHLGRARAAFNNGNLQQMTNDLSFALSRPHNLETLTQSGELYMKAQLWDEAYAVSSQILNVYPQHLPTAARLAEIALRRGDLRAARAWAERLKASHLESDQKLSQSILNSSDQGSL